MTTITPCLWFDGNAEEAVNFYVSVLPDAHIDRITRAVVETPGNKPGSVLLIEFTLAGRPYQALNGGASFPFTEAISLSLLCDDQAEVDRLWSALTADGGMEVQCGWLKDKYGLSWQIVPKRFGHMGHRPGFGEGSQGHGSHAENDQAGYRDAQESLRRRLSQALPIGPLHIHTEHLANHQTHKE